MPWLLSNRGVEPEHKKDVNPAHQPAPCRARSSSFRRAAIIVMAT